MPKLSVYVPDELWNLARQAKPEVTAPSQLIQEGLQRLVGDMPASVPNMEEAIEEVRQRMVRQASEAYEGGYRAAIAAAAHLDWSDLVLLESFKFNVEKWAGAYRASAERHIMAGSQQAPEDVVLRPEDEAPNAETVNALAKALGAWAAPFDSAEWQPDLAYGKGFGVALGQLYGSVVKDVGFPMAGSPAEKGGDAG